jgi:diadenosine tetraphosphate (Ap4A) HIT family hydrolase
MDSCTTCDLVARRDAGAAPPWDSIHRTPHWDVVHAFGTSLEGWIVLVSREHRHAIADLTEDEAAELGPLVRRVSGALHEVVGCEKTYVAQFAEAPGHRHVHVHVVPRASDLPGEHRGPRVFELIGVPGDQWVPEARMDEIAALLAPRLA